MKLLNYKQYVYYFIILNIISSFIINYCHYYEESYKCSNYYPLRIFGFSARDLFITITVGSILGEIIQKNKIKGILTLFIFAPIIHYIYNVDTMINYYLGLSNRPIGMGYIPNCV